MENWGFISADTVSLLTTLIFPGHSLLFWLPLFLSEEEEKELVFPDGDPFPVAGVGLRELTLLHCVLIIYGNSDLLAGVQSGALPRICYRGPQV